MECDAIYIDKMKVKIEINNRTFVIDAERIDGIAPMDTLISALSACTIISISTILKRMQVNFEKLEVHVKGEQYPDPPRTFKTIELIYKVKGNVNQDNLKRAIELTFEKYSPSAVMLKKAGVDLRYSFKIEQ
ncbi:MAG: OsmC family protein [Thermoplasmata archaeon]|jgi:Predicted redox protein, regulator of disulfide bond formation|nr:OsmC family protein [Thermoplasmata archaeon]MVT14315.1 OsmC family peroxiredoxin [Euryarchaeota archaeon]MVT36412.1 OsmC family peroxiredoxin [Euryarchaeota archaeon]